ncbi:hypothetical protein [uncultured Mucilaginibacter sp.]|uniref:hypothetical protein n=1 Tax=uncultured Mucilaginibacter sp. TaxID=797541 RepID=UPI0025F30043|nr:hypothetical protein [uncultured Mucilaginibacter sp.]
MATIVGQFKQILFTAICLLVAASVFAQLRHNQATMIKKPVPNEQKSNFYHLVTQTSVVFSWPKGFAEVQAPDDEDFSFDFALELPGQDFEVWYQIKSEKEDWARFKDNPQASNPDSIYNGAGKAAAASFCGDDKYFERNIPRSVLARNNADAGKSYLLTLLDLPQTKHYKYALLITLQKNHTGTIIAVCFTNVKGPEFFKNVNRATNSLHFKP